jgi:hypothetical protein
VPFVFFEAHYRSQDPAVFSASFAKNIALGMDLTAEQIEAAAKRAHAHEFIAKTKDGYDTLIGRGGESLSGGQRQRVAIARALARDQCSDSSRPMFCFLTFWTLLVCFASRIKAQWAAKANPQMIFHWACCQKSIIGYFANVCDAQQLICSWSTATAQKKVCLLVQFESRLNYLNALIVFAYMGAVNVAFKNILTNFFLGAARNPAILLLDEATSALDGGQCHPDRDF